MFVNRGKLVQTFRQVDGRLDGIIFQKKKKKCSPLRQFESIIRPKIRDIFLLKKKILRFVSDGIQRRYVYRNRDFPLAFRSFSHFSVRKKNVTKMKTVAGEIGIFFFFFYLHIYGQPYSRQWSSKSMMKEIGQNTRRVYVFLFFK